ncbi:MAG: hypothetical protein E7384_00470 [Ruminococcaceae bacterium]|nr:hypothetical protein [Oscillospiraceae bacterium]
MKKCVGIIFFILCFVVIIIGCVHMQNLRCLDSVRFVVSNQNVTESISLFHNNDKYYVFLPSYAKMENINIKSTQGYRVYIDDCEYTISNNCLSLSADKEYSLKICTEFGVTVADETLVILKSENIATMSLRLTNGSIEDIHKDKETEKSGICTLIKSDTEVEYVGFFSSFRSRGNSTWWEKKKPYVIEFEQNVELFNMGYSSKYCLLANACDESNLRNKMVYDASKEIGLTAAIDSEFVDLYIDDVYYGLYLLTENIDISPSCVNITNLESVTQSANYYSLKEYSNSISNVSGIEMKYYDIPSEPTDITGGYLLEIDSIGRAKSDNSYFILPDNTAFSVKFPRYATQGQIVYISNLMYEIKEKLATTDYNDYIDVDSWVKYYLIQECFANTDQYSLYFYKDSDKVSDKVYAGPIWDFDFSMGSLYLGKDANPKAFYSNMFGYYKTLYNNEIFKELLKKEYKDSFRNLLVKYANEKLLEYEKLIQKSYSMNSKRWEGVQPYASGNHYDSFHEHIEYLSRFLNERIAFLDDAWLQNKDFVRVTFSAGDPMPDERIFVSVEKGKCIDNVPIFKFDGYEFLGFVNSVSGEKLDLTNVVEDNISYIASWKKIEDDFSSSSVSNSADVGFVQKLKSMLANKNKYTIVGFTIVFFVISFCIGKDIFVALKKIREKRKNEGFKIPL